MRPFSIVVAFEKNSGIGWQGKIPWHLPADLKHFKDITSNVQSPEKINAVIMGRKTWESLPQKFQPLPGRLNVVITRQEEFFLPKGVLRAASLEQALAELEQPMYNHIENVFVIGGAQIFSETLKYPTLKVIHATRIHQSFPCDVFFPAIPNKFKIAKVSQMLENGISLDFCDYQL